MKFNPVLLLIGAIASAGVVTASILPAAINAQTQSNQSTPQQSGKRQGERWASLNLTEQQKAQMKQIHEQTKSQIQAVLTPDQASKLEAAKGQKGNRRELMSSLGLTEDQKARMKSIKQSSKDKMMAILTPAQQQQLQSMRKPK
jgi:periplasmic protein CpxP/Spy